MTRNADQREFWTNIAGPKWTENQAAMDALMQPVLDGVLDRADLGAGHSVLDIGCGTGASCLQAANRVGSNGHVLGADISATLLDLARQRSADRSEIAYLLADAAAHDFEGARFDHLISRFGVMFFDDPTAAFANMAQALRPGATLSFAAWGQIPNNPFFTLPAQVARSVLGQMPKSDPDAPGPFAFRDPERVLGVLRDAGLIDGAVDVVSLDLTAPGSIEDAAERMMAIGPAEASLTHFAADADQRKTLKAALIEALAPLHTSDGLRIPAEINFFSARKPG